MLDKFNPMNHPFKAGIDASMLGIAGGWLWGALPHLSWIIPTVYYAILISKEWPPACALCTRIRDYIKGFKAGVATNQAIQPKPIEPVAVIQPIIILPPSDQPPKSGRPTE
jgi:hypothetical protein